MTGGRASIIWLVVLAAGIALFTGIWLGPHLKRVAEQAETLDKLESEGELLASRVRDLTTELNEILAGSEEEDTAPLETRLTVNAEVIRQQEEAKRLEQVRLLAATQEQLEDAKLTIDGLQAQMEALESKLSTAEEDNRILREKESELNDQLERANRVVEAIRAEMKGNSERLINMETRNRTLREEYKEAEDKLVETRRLLREIESVHRRREALLTNIARRYREAADEYRAVSLRLREPGQGPGSSGVDLSRIENVLTLADEDFRQLQALDSRASRLHKRLTE